MSGFDDYLRRSSTAEGERSAPMTQEEVPPTPKKGTCTTHRLRRRARSEPEELNSSIVDYYAINILNHTRKPGLGILRCEGREDGAVAARGATTAGTGIALRAARRIIQKAAPAGATFHREPRHVGFRTFLFVCSRGDKHSGRQMPGPRADGRRIVPLKRRSVYGLPADRGQLLPWDFFLFARQPPPVGKH